MNPEAALKRVVAGSRKAFIAVGLFSLAVNLLMLIVPIYMMQMYDRVIASRNVDTLILLTIIAVAGLLCMSLVEMMRSRIMVRLGAWVDRTLSGPVLAGGMNDSLRAGGLTGASGLRELNTLRGFLTGAGIFPLLDAPWVPIFVALIFLIHPVLGYLAVAGAVIVFMFALANDFWTRTPLKQANGAAAKALYRADAMVRNADVAAAMGMEPHLVRRWRDSNEEGLRLQALASDRAGGISSMAKFVRLALQIGMLGTGAYYVTQGQLSGGAMIAASIILSRAMAPIEQSINAWRGMVAAKGAYENIKKLLQRTPATGDAMNLPRPQGQISIEGVGFVPPGAPEPVLRGVTLEISPGECVGLIGASASGKTTLARVIVGSWRPSAGHARLDGADVFIWEAADRGKYIGYLPQDVELFDGPVRENIARLGEPDPDAVIAAAQMAGVHDLILRLPNGYETMIGEGGTRLSGGQRQRIALARALYGDPALVVLDEPNSNLDTDGERALMEALAELKKRGVTTIVVAHRPSVLQSVDRLVVMHQGRVEMEGPRDEILAKVAPGSLEAVRQAELADRTRGGGDAGAGAEIDGGPTGLSGGPSGLSGGDPAANVNDPPPGRGPSGGARPSPPPTSDPNAPAPVLRIRPGGAASQAGASGATGTEPKGDPPPSHVLKPEFVESAPPRAASNAAPTAETAAPASTTETPAETGAAPGGNGDAPHGAEPSAPKVAQNAETNGAVGEADKPLEESASAPAPSRPNGEAMTSEPTANDIRALFSRISAASTPAEETPKSNGADVETNEAANTASDERRGVRDRRPLHPSPTTPGSLFPGAAPALTANPTPGRVTPRRDRKDG